MSQRQKIKYNEMVENYSNEAGEVQGTADVPIMSIMMDLRKLANHPLMLRYYYTDEKVKQIAKILSTHPSYKKNPHPQYIFEELAILSDFQLLQTMERYVSFVLTPFKSLADLETYKKTVNLEVDKSILSYLLFVILSRLHFPKNLYVISAPDEQFGWLVQEGVHPNGCSRMRPKVHCDIF